MRRILLLLALPACATNLPDQPVQRALVRDMARAVQSKEQISWFMDEHEVRSLLPDALDSACRVNPAHRTEALAWLDAELDRHGGSAKEAWLRADKDLDAIQPVLLLD